MLPPSRKIFIISLDGATHDVLRPLMDQGYLPNLKHLAEEGISTELESIVPPVTAPAWTSFMTGKHPSKHGIFDFVRFDPYNSNWKLNNAQHIRGKTIWQLLSEMGKRIVVLNLPYTYPPYEVNGVMVSGWDAPSINSGFVYPPTLEKQILKVIPDYGSTLDLSFWKFTSTTSDEDFTLFVDKLIAGFEQGAKLASHFLDAEDWDVFMVHFQQTDWMQHKLWAYIEEACCKPGDKSSRLQTVRKCYSRFDELVGHLLSKVQPHEPIKIVLSDHGFGRDLGNMCPNYLLSQWGYFHLEKQAGNRARDFFRASKSKTLQAFYRALAAAKHRFFDRLTHKKYKSWADQLEQSVPRQKFPVDWARTKAALVMGSEVGFIYVNVKGRAPFGTVEPGVEYEQLTTDLISRFLELRHPESGKKLLQSAIRSRDIYSDPQDDSILPDIVLIPVDGYGFSSAVSVSWPRITDEGSHRPMGVLFIEGVGIKRNIDHFHPRLIDIAPTILQLLGLPVLSDMDGRVLIELFTEPQNVQYRNPGSPVIREHQLEYTTKEAELIEQRLRGLGYME